MSAQLRGDLYVLTAAILALMSIYGLLTTDQSSAWQTVLEATINVTGATAMMIARRHIPAADDYTPQHAEELHD